MNELEKHSFRNHLKNKKTFTHTHTPHYTLHSVDRYVRMQDFHQANNNNI